MRRVQVGAATIEGMHTGAHTVCTGSGDPRIATEMKFKCTQVKLTAAAKQTASVVVPASWLERR